MNVDVLLEVTEWSADYPVKNGTYAVDKDSGKLVAFRDSKGGIKVFTKPLMFSKSKRKFKKVVDKTLLDAILYT